MVRFDSIRARNGARIGTLTLDAPARLNAQTLAMVDAMLAQLDAWQADPEVVAVLVSASGERAFCAGGDIRALYDAMVTPGHVDRGDRFFAHEYLLCHRVRHYPKPVVALGFGAIMGGGWGLYSAASHRLIRTDAQLAMPEIAIGLFPDVGASRWLHALPDGLGRFLALTGSRINASDAVASGVAHGLTGAVGQDELAHALAELNWQGARNRDDDMLSDWLAGFVRQHRTEAPASRWVQARHHIEDLVGGDGLEEIAARLQRNAKSDDWVGHGCAHFLAGAPTSATLIWRLAERALRIDDDALLALETEVARFCLRHGDFREGVRAKLVDRDGLPRWRATTLADAQLQDLPL
ncbi:enoyl-CoA hydratase/isomerase family protein [Jeongeupia naejangsanensis]|uniref:3-hydroxyisobutyryl-CoA hydrolase n=1 Tax=Jeongeupia naejangsanensis TaxID=613195 RepID=A0ABS2BKX3_9NEIS|nr:enoyl-CoA hydratase/isomerase family protein [Jeongeupia naejangsanensis]MBM3116264.1 enoyl-CoA hydratase/isomerase family protein [Jeongeupia naejangsanensis]